LCPFHKHSVMQLKQVVLKTGETIKVLPREVEGLRKAGLLKRPTASKPGVKKKEDKSTSKTKEEKDTGETK